MQQITDPHKGLLSFQAALTDRRITPVRCTHQPKLLLLHDDAEGTPRLTYAIAEDGIVQATVVCVIEESINGLPCFGIGYAVAEPFRGKGLGYEIVERAIDELGHGFSKQLPALYIEAIVGADNEASQKIASKLISSNPKPIKEHLTGLPAYQYLKLLRF